MISSNSLARAPSTPSPNHEPLVQRRARALQQSLRRRRRGSGRGGTRTRRRWSDGLVRRRSLRRSSAPRSSGARAGGFRHELDDAAPGEDPADDRRRPITPALVPEAVEPRGQQRLDRRRNGDVAAGRVLGASRASARRRAGCRRRPRRSAAASPGGSAGPRPRRPPRRPPRPRAGPADERPAGPLGPARPAPETSGRVVQRTRIGAAPATTCSTSSRNVASAQCTSSNTTTRGRRAASPVEQLARRPEQLLDGEVAASASPTATAAARPRPVRPRRRPRSSRAPRRAGRPRRCPRRARPRPSART